jgi:hypothetical protein
MMYFLIGLLGGGDRRDAQEELAPSAHAGDINTRKIATNQGLQPINYVCM